MAEVARSFVQVVWFEKESGCKNVAKSGGEGPCDEKACVDKE